MQKIINVLALSSFVVSAAVVGGGTWLYLNKDVMLEEAREKIATAATEAIAGALPECWMRQCLICPKQQVV